MTTRQTRRVWAALQKMRRLGLMRAVLGAAWLVSCGAAQAAPPQRIISLMPSLTETVCALEACDRLVGTDRYSDWPSSPVKVAALPKLGGLDDISVERVLALKPDLVLASPSHRVVERLRSLGLNVVVIEARSRDEARQMVERVATLLGRPAQGPLLWQRIEAQVQQAVQRVPPTLRGRTVYFEVDRAPYAAGQASFIGEILQRFGLVNIVPEALGPFPKLNPEYIVKAKPDLIMAVERNVEEMPRRPGWTGLTALQAQRTCAFERQRHDVLVRPGPRLGEAAELVAECLVKLAPRLGSDTAAGVSKP